MDSEQTARFNYFQRFAHPDNTGLEIGPLTRPTFPAHTGYSVQTLDHASTENLKKKYESDPAIDVSRIVDVDWVWSGGAYTDIEGIPTNFDFIVSCHSIEHSVDVVQFLQDLSSLLSPEGRVFLVTPHRSTMFDFYRPLTTLGDVLMGHHYPKALDMKARIDELELASALNGAICWSPDEGLVGRIRRQRPTPIRTRESLPELLADLSKWAEEKDYRDGHRWVFEPESLTVLIASLRQLGLCDFQVADYQPGVGCEFMMVLEKTTSTAPPSPSELESYWESMVPAAQASQGTRDLFQVQAFAALARRLFRRAKTRAGAVLRRLGLR
jgi:SAM-dependent methyltransferase